MLTCTSTCELLLESAKSQSDTKMESESDGDGDERRSRKVFGRDLLSSAKFNGFAEQAFDRLHDHTLFHALRGEISLQLVRSSK
jgi:hypothetical protein